MLNAKPTTKPFRVPDFELGMIVGGGGVTLAITLLAIVWRILVVKSDFWRNAEDEKNL